MKKTIVITILIAAALGVLAFTATASAEATKKKEAEKSIKSCEMRAAATYAATIKSQGTAMVINGKEVISQSNDEWQAVYDDYTTAKSRCS